jgi:hypothetical protein
VKYTIEIVEANGNRRTIVETPKYDGKDYPRSGIAEADADTVALKRMDANTVEEIQKKAGKVVLKGQTGSIEGRENGDDYLDRD